MIRKLLYSLCALTALAVPAMANISCGNNSSDQSTVQNALNAGGTVTISAGTCSITSNLTMSVNNTTLQAASGASVILQGNGSAAIVVSGSSDTIGGASGNGLVLDNLTVAGANNTRITGFNFTYNTLRNVGGSSGSAISFFGLISSSISHNSFSNIWPGGWPAAPQNTCTQSNGNPGDDCWGMSAIAVYTSDGVNYDWNTFDEISADAIHLSFENNIVKGGLDYTPQNVSVSFNTITHLRRIPIEIQAAPSYPNCDGGTCDVSIPPVNNLTVQGNYAHDYSYPMYDTWGASLVPDHATNTLYLNNTFVMNIDSANDLDTNAHDGGNGPFASCMEIASDGITVQGNLCLSPTGTNLAYGGMYAIGAANSSSTTTLQNDISCGGTSNSTSINYESSYKPTVVNQDNYFTTSACPQGSSGSQLPVSGITNSGVSVSGSTFSVSFVSNLSIRFVQTTVDGTLVNTQYQSDLNSNFSTDRKLAYHSAITESNYSGGTHTVQFTATDASGATNSVSTTFTNGTVVNCSNSSGDASAVQNAVNAGGTVTITGTCNMGTTTLNPSKPVTMLGSGTAATDSFGRGANTATVLSWTDDGNYGLTYAGNGLTIQGFTWKGRGIESTVAYGTAQGSWTIKNNTFENMTNIAQGYAAIMFPQPVGSTSSNLPIDIENNVFLNIWIGGYPNLPNSTNGTVAGCHNAANTSSQWNDQNCSGGNGIFWNLGIDNITVNNNLFSEIGYNGTKGGFDAYLSKSGPYLNYTAHNIKFTNNEFTRIFRIAQEAQGSMGSNCQGGCNASHPPHDGLVWTGNYAHDFAYAYQPWPFSALWGGTNATYANNTGIDDAGTWGACGSTIGIEDGMLGGTTQGNVLGSTCAQGFGSYIIDSYGQSGYTDTYQNNVMCGPNAPSQVPLPKNTSSATIVDQYEYRATSCPAGSNLATSSIAGTVSVSGSTYSAAFTSNLSLRQVQVFVDGALVSTQSLGDVNTNFANDRKLLYHATITQSNYGSGTHTVQFTATDVAGQTGTASASFSNGTSSAPVAPTGLTATANGQNSIALSWAGSTGATSYNVYGAATCGAVSVSSGDLIAGSVSSTSYTDTTLTASTSRCYEVTAYNGAESGPSNQASATTSGLTELYQLANVPAGGTTIATTTALQTQHITCGLWINGTSQTNYPAFCADGGTDSAYPWESFILQASTIDGTSPLDVYWTTGSSTTYDLKGKTKLQPNTWYYIAATYDGTTMTLYLNGAVEASQTLSAAAPLWYPSNTIGVGIGRKASSTSNNLSGAAGTVTLWNGAQPQSWVQAQYNAGPPSLPSCSVGAAECTTTPGNAITLTSTASVNWSLRSGSIGSLVQNSNTQATYTPPATASTDSARNSLAGCMVTPNDSVYATRIDSLPVASNSTTWIGKFAGGGSITPSWDVNLIDNTWSATPFPMYFYYTPNANSQTWHAQDPPLKQYRENGAWTTDGTTDHHELYLNTTNCHFEEIYQYRHALSSNTCSNISNASDSSGCTAQSGFQYDGFSEALANSQYGATDAAGLCLECITLRAADVEEALASGGEITHALRFTSATGYIEGGSLQSNGTWNCGNATNAAAGYIWPAMGSGGLSTGANCDGSAAPYGARLRLKSSFDITGGGANSAATQKVLLALQHYGAFLADISGAGNQFTFGNDMYTDPQMSTVVPQLSHLDMTQFEIVDESSFMLSSSIQSVDPSNTYDAPSNSAIIVATPTAGGAASYVPVTILPVTIGFAKSYQSIPVGATAQLSAIVNNSSQGATYSISACSSTGNCGSITSSGAYTAPTSVPAGTAPVATITATSAQDTRATAVMYLTILPRCQSSDASITVCIDSAGTSFYTDTAGNQWLPDTQVLTSSYQSIQDDTYPSTLWNYDAFGNKIADPHLWATMLGSVADVGYGPFLMPNGRYKITLGFGVGSSVCGQLSSGFGSYPVGIVPYRDTYMIDAQGQIVAWNYDPGLLSTVQHMCFTPSTLVIPANVTNGQLEFWIRGWGTTNDPTNSPGGNWYTPNLYGFNVSEMGAAPDGSQKRYYSGYIDWVRIDVDNSNAHWCIDTQQLAATDSCGTSNPFVTMQAGTKVQMTLVDWGTGKHDPRWSVTGPGSISTSGVYTAPSSQAITQPVIITATDGSYTANATIWIQGSSYQVP